jgi:tRNA-dihydrouridine synthase C
MQLILAPMEGVIDHTMRDLLTRLGGLDRCVTEFVRVSDQLLPPRVFYRYCPELKRGGQVNGVPIYLQLLGGQPGPLAENAARAAELGAPGIDLNFGCPAKTVNRSDGGSIILREPERISALVSAVRRALPPAVPLSVKIRLGFEDRSRLRDNVDAINAAGASEIIVHGRTRADGYRPPAYWDQIARMCAWSRINVIANGEIWSPQDAHRCRLESGCPDLMLGRGVLCRPDLPRLVAGDTQRAGIEPLDWAGILELVSRQLDSSIEHYELRHAGNPVKQWLGYLRHYYPQAALLFEQIKRERDPLVLQATLRTRQSAERHRSGGDPEPPLLRQIAG